MKRRNINVNAVTPAPAAVVYGLLADGSSWPAWSAIESVEIELLEHFVREDLNKKSFSSLVRLS